MGKKSGNSRSSTTTTSSSSSSSAATSKRSSDSTADQLRTRSNSFVSLINHVENTLKALEANTVASGGNAKVLSLEEAERLLQVLEGDYKAIAVRNKVDSKKEEKLQQFITEVENVMHESKREIQSIQEEINQGTAKVEKLEKLSQMLAGRLKTADSKMADEMKEEKENRLQMSMEFSEKIKDISTKLDTLTQRREILLAENERLKQVLKHCLEDFEREQAYEIQRESQQQKIEGLPTSEELSCGTNTATGEVTEGEGIDQEETKRTKQELSNMEMEDDIATIVKLRAKEDELKLETIRYMEIFDSFQVRLTESNKMFKLKQSKVEEITNQIRNLEKNNQKTKSHIVDCSNSTNGMLEGLNQVKSEKEKFLKMMEKQRALIEKFQSDILAMEGNTNSSSDK